ncbi:MAG: hypothetical protein Q9193_001047 [Seirophora villosa]
MFQALHWVPEIIEHLATEFRNVLRRSRCVGEISGSCAADETQQRNDHSKAAKGQVRSVQQGPFDFWQKLLAEVEAEEPALGRTNTSCDVTRRPGPADAEVSSLHQ